MVKVSIKQGEAKVLPFKIRDRRTGRPLDLTGAAFLLWVKRSPEDAAPVFAKADTDFEKTAAASGYVTTFLTAYDTYRAAPWTYQAELRVIRAGNPAPIEKLAFELEIMKAMTPNDWTLQLTGIGSLEALGVPVVSNL
jgi:hypothetical protein